MQPHIVSVTVQMPDWSPESAAPVAAQFLGAIRLPEGSRIGLEWPADALHLPGADVMLIGNVRFIRQYSVRDDVQLMSADVLCEVPE